MSFTALVSVGAASRLSFDGEPCMTPSSLFLGSKFRERNGDVGKVKFSSLFFGL